MKENSMRNNNLRIKERQTAHLVDPSPWPLQMAVILGTTLLGIIILIINKTSKGIIGGPGEYSQGNLVIYSLIGVILIFILWFRDILRESVYTGNHTVKVKEGIMIGYLLFLLTEILIFVTIFWAVLNSTISPNSEVLGMWPPTGIKELEGLELPLNNTIILLGSGVTITIAHNKIISLNKNRGLLYTILTVILSMWFTMNQYIEYKEASFTINDSIFGSGFFTGTGLHAIHITIGTIYLIIGAIRLYKSDITDSHHLGIETGIIYWHMVDVVWLFLYIIVYNTIWS